MNRNWRELKAARAKRELRVERGQVSTLRREVSIARNDAEVARRAPLNRLRAEALSFLASRTSKAIEMAMDVHLRRALENIERIAINRVEVWAEDRFVDRQTVFHVEIPRAEFCFMADIGRMAE